MMPNRGFARLINASEDLEITVIKNTYDLITGGTLKKGTKARIIGTTAEWRKERERERTR